jgi:hypothetical protein
VTGRRSGCWYAAAGVVDLGASAWLLNRARFGGIDPLSAATSTMSLMLGCRRAGGGGADVAMAPGQRPGAWSCGLAGAVDWEDQWARQQLPGGHDRAIDVEVDVRQAPEASPPPCRRHLGHSPHDHVAEIQFERDT